MIGGLYTLVSPFITLSVLMSSTQSDELVIMIIRGLLYLMLSSFSIFFIYTVMKTLHLNNIINKKIKDDEDNYVNLEDLKK